MAREHYLDGFLIAKRAENRSPVTIEGYGRQLRRFLSFVNGGGFDATTVRAFLLERQRTVSPASVHADYRVIKAFFNWLAAEELIPDSDNPIKKVKPPRVPAKLLPIFSPDHIADLLELCAGKSFLELRNRAIILVLLDTGLRVSECAAVRLSDLNGDVITVWGKGAKQRRVRIGALTQKAVWRYLLLHDRIHDHLWLTEERRPMHKRGIMIMLYRLGKRAGIEGARCSAHTFRHTFAVQFLRGGGDLFNLRYLLGHETLEMTRRYAACLGAEDAAAAHAKSSPVDHLLRLRTRREDGR